MANVRFTVTQPFDAPARTVWDALIDWKGHETWIPATKVEIHTDGDPTAIGSEFTATTGYGPLALPDTMRVTRCAWDDGAGTGDCEVEKLAGAHRPGGLHDRADERNGQRGRLDRGRQGPLSAASLLPSPRLPGRRASGSGCASWASSSPPADSVVDLVGTHERAFTAELIRQALHTRARQVA